MSIHMLFRWCSAVLNCVTGGAGRELRRHAFLPFNSRVSGILCDGTCEALFEYIYAFGALWRPMCTHTHALAMLCCLASSHRQRSSDDILLMTRSPTF